jgi:hypothetical protein
MKTLIALLCLASAFCFAQQNSAPETKDMKGMNMPGHDMSQMPAQSPAQSPAQGLAEDTPGNAQTMQSMEGHHMEMGAHMKMTAMRPIQPGDAEKAQQIVVSARAVMEKYKDYHVALDEGFKIFHPEVPQKQYHFTNYKFGAEAFVSMNPDHPTSLLYEKDGEGYRLVGVMYTAPKRLTEDDLNQRIPLSIAQWHEHVNFCAPPKDRRQEMLLPNAKFGLKGSITTEADCTAAGGEFHPVIFNWMVHVYPLEKDPAQIWSVERQHAD